ncbi:hypothetical protein OIO90_004421, partial [Microbotryomycetes sp. JL221]
MYMSPVSCPCRRYGARLCRLTNFATLDSTRGDPRYPREATEIEHARPDESPQRPFDEYSVTYEGTHKREMVDTALQRSRKARHTSVDSSKTLVTDNVESSDVEVFEVAREASSDVEIVKAKAPKAAINQTASVTEKPLSTSNAKSDHTRRRKAVKSGSTVPKSILDVPAASFDAHGAGASPFVAPRRALAYIPPTSSQLGSPPRSPPRSPSR